MIQRLFDARKHGFVSLRARNMVNVASVNGNLAQAESGGVEGRLLAIDLGAKRVGVAVSDELLITVRPLATIERRSWKELLRQVREQIEAFDARGLVIGLPLNIDGTAGTAAEEARQTAAKFELSLRIPIYLQDERLTTEEAKSRLRDIKTRDRAGEIDSAAAAIILEDFIAQMTHQSTPET